MKLKKKVLPLILAMSLFISSIPVNAATYQDEYNAYKNSTYSSDISMSEGGLNKDKATSALAYYQKTMWSLYKATIELPDDNLDDLTNIVSTLNDAISTMKTSVVATSELTDTLIPTIDMTKLNTKQAVVDVIGSILTSGIPTMNQKIMADIKSTSTDGQPDATTINTITTTQDMLENPAKYNEEIVALGDEFTSFKLDTSIADSTLSTYSADFTSASSSADTQVEQGAGGTSAALKSDIADYRFILESIGYVTRIGTDKIDEMLEGEPNVTEVDLTGPDMFEPIEGYKDNTLNNTYVKESVRLRGTYLDMFAATSVYQPFVSKTGDADYMKGLMYLTDEDSQSELQKLFEEINSYKKPLYAITDKKSMKQAKKNDVSFSYENYSGTTVRLTLGMLLGSLENKDDLVALTKKGKLVQDGTGFVYNNYEVTNRDGGLAVFKSVSEDTAESTVSEATGTKAILELSYNSNGTFTSLNNFAGDINGAVLSNIYASSTVKDKWTSRLDETVYVDAIGNIVLADNTVVYPAAANATYYHIIDGNPLNSTMGMSTNVTNNYQYYNVFTVAFMNSYPDIASSLNYSTINSKADKSKTLFVSDNKDPQINEGDTFKTTLFYSLPIPEFKSDWVHIVASGFDNEFRVPNGSSQNTYDSLYKIITGDIKYDTGAIMEFNDDGISSGWNTYPIAFNDLALEGSQIFPYSGTTSETGITPAEVIAYNFKTSLVDPNATEDKAPGVGLVRESYLLFNVAQTVLDGIYNPMTYEKARAGEDIANGNYNYNFIEKIALTVPQFLLGIGSKMDSYLSVSNSKAYMFTATYKVLTDNAQILLAFIFILFTFNVIRNRGKSAATITSILILIGLSFSSVYIMPVVLPTIVNYSTTLMSKGIVSDAIIMNNERYNNDYKRNYLTTLPTVPLYQVDYKTLKELAGEDDNIYTYSTVLDSNFGVGINQTKITLDLNTFFESYYITNELEQSSNTRNLIKVFKDTDNYDLVENYVPYFLLQDGLLQTLETYQDNYDLSLKYISYPNGIYKDSYLVSSYINSYAFLRVVPEVEMELINSDDIEEIERLNSIFPNKGDILNLSNFVLAELDDDSLDPYRETVWFNNLVTLGYYDTELGMERRKLLADIVNVNTYDYLVSITPEPGLVSDDNIIKLTTLYALLAFNREVSTIGNNIHPQTLSQGDLTLTDILSSAMLSDSQRYLYYSVDILNSKISTDGYGGAFVLTVIVLEGILQSLLTIVLQGCLYIGLLFYYLLAIIQGRDLTKLLSGTLKLIALTVGHCVLINLILVFYGTDFPLTNDLVLAVIMGAEAFYAWKYFLRIIGEVMADGSYGSHNKALASYNRKNSYYR